MGVKVMRMFVSISKNLTQLSCDTLSFKDVRSFLAGVVPSFLLGRKESVYN